MKSEELLLKAGIPVPTDWSRDGRFILYSQSAEKSRRDIWALPLTGPGQPYHLLNTAFDEYRAQLSPDGRWLAYVSDESGSYEVYVQSFTSDGKPGGDKARISTSGGNRIAGQREFELDGRGAAIAQGNHLFLPAGLGDAPIVRHQVLCKITT